MAARKQVTIYLPAELVASITARARAERRSVSAMVEVMLMSERNGNAE